MVVTGHACTPEDLFSFRACIFVLNTDLVRVDKEELDLVAEGGNRVLNCLELFRLIGEELLDCLRVQVRRDPGEGTIRGDVELQLALDDEAALLEVVDEATAHAQEVVHLRLAQHLGKVLLLN